MISDALTKANSGKTLQNKLNCLLNMMSLNLFASIFTSKMLLLSDMYT